jgi:hypothetical protein
VAPRFTSSSKIRQEAAAVKASKPFIKKVSQPKNAASISQDDAMRYDWENKAALRSDCTWVFC